MNHFSIIQALCRSLLNYDREIALYQIERLIEALKKDGCEKEAKSLTQIISYSSKKENLTPQNISISAVSGEELRPTTPIPVDKETAAPILEIIFPEQISISEPIFDDEIKEAVNSVILEWSNYGELIKLNATPSRSCLIFGAPGTGKTHLAKWIAKQLHLPLVSAKLDGIVSSFLGTSSRNIGNLFAFANRYKCILLLDEFDAIAKLRNDPQEVGEVKRIVNTLLQCLDEREKIGFSIGITNHEQLLDPAIWRRFDVQIEIPKPSSKTVSHLIKTFMEPISLSDADIKFLTWFLKDASGADVEKLSNWIKRMKIIPKYKDDSLLILMKRYSVLNNGRVSDDIKAVLNMENEEICNTLINSDMNLKQKEVAEILSITPSSLSKQISKYKKD